MPARLSGSGLAAERGGRAVFTGIGFAVAGGEMLAVTGPNGAGKSTLLRVVAGLLQPVAGAIRLEPEPDGGIAAAVHYLGHLDALKPSLSVGDNLGFWRRLYGGDGDVEVALESVGLAYLSTCLPAASRRGRSGAWRSRAFSCRSGRSGFLMSRQPRSMRGPRRCSGG